MTRDKRKHMKTKDKDARGDMRRHEEAEREQTEQVC